MHRIARLAALSFCFLALPASAAPFGVLEQQGPKHDTVTINPLALAFGGLQVEYEHAPSAKMSWFLAPQLQFNALGLPASAFGLEAGVRYFMTGAAPRGFFLSPKANVEYVSVLGVTGLGWGVGGMAGYTWIFDDTWDVSVGGGMHLGSYTFDAGGFGLGSSFYVAPDLRLAVGTTF